MKSLSDSQVDFIARDLRRNGVTFEDLRDDLLDHLCCAVEAGMEAGQDFETAYAETRRAFSPEGLKAIQQDTISYAYKKEVLMKKIMLGLALAGVALLLTFVFSSVVYENGDSVLPILFIGLFCTVGGFMGFSYTSFRKHEDPTTGLKSLYIIGYASVSTFILGFVLKIMHWPGAGVAIVCGAMTIVMAFLPMLYMYLYRRAKDEQLLTRIGYFAAYIGTAVLFTGMLFKTMHWPMANVLMVSGLLTFNFAILPAALVKMYRNSIPSQQ